MNAYIITTQGNRINFKDLTSACKRAVKRKPFDSCIKVGDDVCSSYDWEDIERLAKTESESENKVDNERPMKIIGQLLDFITNIHKVKYYRENKNSDPIIFYNGYQKIIPRDYRDIDVYGSETHHISFQEGIPEEEKDGIIEYLRKRLINEISYLQ